MNKSAKSLMVKTKVGDFLTAACKSDKSPVVAVRNSHACCSPADRLRSEISGNQITEEQRAQDGPGPWSESPLQDNIDGNEREAVHGEGDDSPHQRCILGSGRRIKS